MLQHSDEISKSIALSAMAENFGKEMSEGLLTMWLELLSEYQAPQVHAAIKKVIETYEFKTLPPFAVLKKALDDLAGIGKESLELQACAEWDRLNMSVIKHGKYNKPELHATTEYVLRQLGGWSAACQWTEQEETFKRKDFVKLWADAHGRVEVLQLGASGVLGAISQGQDRRTGPQHVGSVVAGVLGGAKL